MFSVIHIVHMRLRHYLSSLSHGFHIALTLVHACCTAATLAPESQSETSGLLVLASKPRELTAALHKPQNHWACAASSSLNFRSTTWR